MSISPSSWRLRRKISIWFILKTPYVRIAPKKILVNDPIPHFAVSSIMFSFIVLFIFVFYHFLTSYYMSSFYTLIYTTLYHVTSFPPSVAMDLEHGVASQQSSSSGFGGSTKYLNRHRLHKPPSIKSLNKSSYRSHLHFSKLSLSSLLISVLLIIFTLTNKLVTLACQATPCF